MNSENLSHTIYRDHDIQGRTSACTPTASWQQLNADDDRAERFEVLLRLLLVVCVGAAMLACGVRTPGSTPVTTGVVQCAPTVPSACVAAEATTAVRIAQNL